MAKLGNNSIMASIRHRAEQSLAFASLVAIFVFFTFANEAFATWSNITGILLSTAVIGLLALAITRLQLPPFIATLAMMLIAKGLALVISGVKPIYLESIEGYNDIALGQLIPNLPNAVLIFFASAFVASIVLNRTIIGRYTFAIGSNEEATRLSGINVDRWKILVYIIGGIYIGLAGIVLSSRLSSAQPALGQGYELEAIAAVIIGGTSLLGGKGSITGTVIGALIMAVLINGLRIMEIRQEWQTVVTGLVIIVAVYADSIRRRNAGEL